MHGAEQVALYAVMLREAVRNHHTSEQCLLDDFASCREEVSLAAMLAHEHFTELDWHLVALLIDHPTEVLEVARLLYGEHEQTLEAEALLHAVEPHGKRTSAQWASPFRARWQQVRGSIRAFEREGVATRFGDLDQLVNDTFRAKTGATDEELFDVFIAPQVDVEMGRVPHVTLSRRRSELLNFVGHAREG